MSCAIEMIKEHMLQLVPIIYKTRFEVCVPIKGIFFMKLNELLHEIITIGPRIIASFYKVFYMLFGILFAIKLLEVRRLIIVATQTIMIDTHLNLW